jgi:hypothetical protein
MVRAGGEVIVGCNTAPALVVRRAGERKDLTSLV